MKRCGEQCPASQGLASLVRSIPEEPPRVEAELRGVFSLAGAEPLPAPRSVSGPGPVQGPQRVAERRRDGYEGTFQSDGGRGERGLKSPGGT